MIQFAIVCKHLRVVIGRQEGVAQSEVAREIAYGESRFLLVRLYGMCIRVLWLPMVQLMPTWHWGSAP